MFNLQKIKKLVKIKKLTYKEFANEIGVTEQTVHNWFQNRTKISIDQLEKIASYFEVPVSYFFDESGSNINSVVNNGNISNNKIVGSNIQITLAKKENEIELLKAKLESCQNENKTLRELIDVLKEKCR